MVTINLISLIIEANSQDVIIYLLNKYRSPINKSKYC